MKTPDSVYLVMYPSEDPANEPFETFRWNRIFFQHPSAQAYIHHLFKMLPDIEVNRKLFNSNLSTIDEKELSRMVLTCELAKPKQQELHYAIVEMELHGKFSISYGKSHPRGKKSTIYADLEVLHILETHPKTEKPKTQYMNIHSVHASLDSIFETSKAIVGINQYESMDWHRPFGHQTDHMYAEYVDDSGVTKYLVMAGCRML